MTKKIFKGKSKPLGATIRDSGVNFALFSKNATEVTLHLKEGQEEQLIPLDPKLHRTGNVWHIFIKELSFPLRYAFTLNGPQESPHFFHPENLLTDPYAVLLDSSSHWNDDSLSSTKPFALLENYESFDWEGVENPKLQMKDLVIYEMHVRGFTKHSSSEVTYPGTFLGFIEKIPYLRELGITAVELMPIFEFNECEYKKCNPLNGQKLVNYWGYSTINYFMPMNRYTSGSMNAILEFKTLVRELHRNGIEVILDIVFNHTGEKEAIETIYSFKGIDRLTYYIIDKDKDTNYTGCGNTMNLNHPVMRRFVKECLYYWVTEMHIDGFRFDLASTMNRDVHGKLLQPSALIEGLTYDPFLSDIKLIAEPWDLQGYQLGCFYPEESRWSEWNDKYRDAVRKFIKGDPHSKNEFAARITGSQDLFPHRTPSASINFVTVHDGFSLADLVSYNEKHNQENGENNQDGTMQNYSWNCGAEGPTNEVEIFNLRQRQIKNFFFALFLSKGVPLLLMGDEYCHTKEGNNNTWCQDNELNWFNWEMRTPIFNFVQCMIRFRKEHPQFTEDRFYKADELIWLDAEGEPIRWEEPTPFLAAHLLYPEEAELFLVFNATQESVSVVLPKSKEGKQWHLLINTNGTHPYDFMKEDSASILKGSTYLIQRHTSILLKLI